MKLFIRHYFKCDVSGFTLVEILVANFIGLMLVGLAISGVTHNRDLYQYDLVRNRVNQNLRTSLEIIGDNARESGENLPSNFPAVEVVDGVASAPDEIIFRQNLVDESLKLCQPISMASGGDKAYFSVAGDVAGCAYTEHAHNFEVWQSYVALQGKPVSAFIYNPVSKQGEFFKIAAIMDSGSDYFLQRLAGSGWSRDYPVGLTSIYLIEESHFSLEPDAVSNSFLLRKVRNQDISVPQYVMYGISDLQVSIGKKDGTVVTSFGRGDSWKDIAFIQLTMTATDSARKAPFSRTLSSRFFPRNVLSN